MNRIFITFLLCEVAYVVSARSLAHTFTGSLLHLELYWSGIRLLSAVALIWLFRQVAPAKSERPARISAPCLFATGIFLAPVLVRGAGLEGHDRYVFAALSVLVGLREELAYRGILQGFLTRRFGITLSLLISNVLFIGYHFGVQPFTVHYVLQLFLVGTILGVVYHLSGSIILVVALHSIYDAIDSFSPFLAQPMPDFVCTIVLVSTLAALLIANKRPNSESGGTPQPPHDSG